jgi:orotidine-5'-phosphate decarboxylase
MKMNLSNPLIVGLDVDSTADCFRIANLLSGKVGAFKIGPRLPVRYGADLISHIAKSAPVFVDNKYFDIPSTMVAAVRASFVAGATLVTVHALAGREALSELAKLEAELEKKRPFKILAVTILTSFSDQNLPAGLKGQSIDDLVPALAEEVVTSGLSGLVCSPREAAAIRKRYPDLFLVTPGVRLPDAESGDQKRVETPQEAIKNGASALVVARPICDSANPLVAALKYLDAIAEARK